MEWWAAAAIGIAPLRRGEDHPRLQARHAFAVLEGRRQVAQVRSLYLRWTGKAQAADRPQGTTAASVAAHCGPPWPVEVRSGTSACGKT
jgi:hypothetical protein